MFPNAQLCKVMLNRLTDQAYIIETGTQSYRFERIFAKKAAQA
jgi:hypothetical protein